MSKCAVSQNAVAVGVRARHLWSGCWWPPTSPSPASPSPPSSGDPAPRLAGAQAARRPRRGGATPNGYRGERGTLLDLYRARTRPNLVEPESYWYSTRPLTEQARRVHALASDERTTIASSADLAPDLLAPWRHPTVPAEGRADASLVLRWTDDQGLLSPADPWRDEVDGLPIVGPCQQWWDLLDLGGEDRAEAADRLRAAILTRALPRTR